MNDDWTPHLEAAEAKAKTLALNLFTLAEQLSGWAHVAQLDNAVLEATVDARTAARKVRNLLLPDDTFPDEVR